MESLIYIIRLPHEAGLLSAGVQGASALGAAPRKVYAPITLVPGTAEEAEALCAWVNTHQSMFLTVGAACTALTRALERIEEGDAAGAMPYLRAAKCLRRASSVYTYLPKVGRGVYERFLRRAMRMVRPGFSGVSSREAIAFSRLIRRLRAISLPPEAAASAQTEELKCARKECIEADDLWWRLHVEAMHRMVEVPVSLAQHEFKRSMREGSKKSYSEFLATSLQVPEAMDDYDRFFGCERGAVTRREYLETLEVSLRLSDEHISTEEPFASYRAGLLEQVSSLCDEGGFR